MTRILAHTLGGNFKSFCEVNQKFQRFLLFFFIIPHHTKGNQAAGQNRACIIGAYRIVQALYSKERTTLNAVLAQRYASTCTCTHALNGITFKVGVNPSLKREMWLLMDLITKKTVQKYTFLESEKPDESNGGHRFL